VGNSQHLKIGTGQFIEAGDEIHYYAGSKVIIDAGMELTASGGGSFLKLDPSGVTLSGATIRMNSGGAAGKGSGLKILAPVLPWLATSAVAGSLTLPALINMSRQLKQAAAAKLLLVKQCGMQADGSCQLEVCPCGKNESTA